MFVTFTILLYYKSLLVFYNILYYNIYNITYKIQKIPFFNHSIRDKNLDD